MEVMLRNIAYSLLIILLVAAIAALVIGSVVFLSTFGAAKSVAEPVGDLVRSLVVEATPVILPDPVLVMQEVTSLAQLQTKRYAFQDILEIERNQEVLWGAFGESLLFVAYGEVTAGVDLEKIGPRDIQVTGPTTVMIHLPEAEVLVVDLDNEKSHVADRDIGFFTDADPDLETLVRQEAESQMLEAALASGILEDADQESRRFMSSFLQELGFEEVIFTDQTPPTAEPYIQELPKGYELAPAATAIP